MAEIPHTSQIWLGGTMIVLALPPGDPPKRRGVAFLSQDGGSNYQELLHIASYSGIVELGCFDQDMQPGVVHAERQGERMAFAIPGRITQTHLLKVVDRLPRTRYGVNPFTDGDMANFLRLGLIHL